VRLVDEVEVPQLCTDRLDVLVLVVGLLVRVRGPVDHALLLSELRLLRHLFVEVLPSQEASGMCLNLYNFMLSIFLSEVVHAVVGIHFGDVDVLIATATGVLPHF